MKVWRFEFTPIVVPYDDKDPFGKEAEKKARELATGVSFMHGNTREHTHCTAYELVQFGMHFPEEARKLINEQEKRLREE